MKLSITRFKNLIPMSLLNDLAVEYTVNAPNQVKLPGQSVFLCLLNGLLSSPELTQRMLEEQYKKITGNSCDHSSFGKRLSTLKPDYFAAILAHIKDKVSDSITKGSAQALKLRIVDATITTLSAKLLHCGIRANNWGRGKKQVKSVIEISDEGLPNLLHICKDQSELADVIALGEPMKANAAAGDVFVFDKGCHGRQVLLSLHQSQAFWVTPHTNQLYDVTQTLYDADPSIPGVPEVNEPALLIYKVQRAIFHNKSSNLDGLESMPVVVIHSYRWDVRASRWKPFVLMTNLPVGQSKTGADVYSFEEVTELYRRRWEIETFFKMIKQHLGYEHLTSRSENGIYVMILMSMITALLMIWYKQQADIRNGWKAVKFWLADDVRTWTSRSIHSMQVCQT